LATTLAYSRKMPGRIIGVSVDSAGKPALRMAMQTREQHIRRDKATSNICTAQALLANMAAFYGVYHGPEGLRRIASRVHGMAVATADALSASGFKVLTPAFFDTFTVDVSSKGMTAADIQRNSDGYQVNVRVIDDKTVGIAFGEAITEADTIRLLKCFGVASSALNKSTGVASTIPAVLARESPFLTHPVFNTHHSETQMLRYLKSLEQKDLSLNTSMISLGSCTMKLNASVEMVPVTWPETCNMHPFVPKEQTRGYQEMIASLNKDLAEITG
jgi:glycine dehydrogenase